MLLRKSFVRFSGVRAGVAIVILALSGALALAPVSAETGRYTMTPTKDGVLKLDTKTGAVSLCQSVEGQLRCARIADEGADKSAQNDEIERLREENQALKEQALLPPEELAPGTAERGGKLELPTKEDVDKVMTFLEDVIRRFKGLAEDMPRREPGTPL